MGRSVSTPHGAEVVAFNEFDPRTEEGNPVEDGSFEWECMTDDFQYQSMIHWPSLTKCNKWIGREDHALLENGHCYAGVSEYCGVVAFWIVPKEEGNQLAIKWCQQVKEKFEKTFGKFQKVGTFSNGESVYQVKK